MIRKTLIQKHIILLLLLFVIIPMTRINGKESTLVKVRHGFFGTRMRIVFDFDAPFEYNINKELSKIIFSFPNVHLANEFISKTLRYNNIIINDIQFNSNDNGNVNAVIRCNSDCISKIIQINDPLRLAVDFFINPDVNSSVDFYFNRGLEYENNGEYNNALSEYRKAIALEPGHPESYFHAGVIRFLKGEYDKALINFRKVPENSELGKEAVRCILKILEPDDKEEKLVSTNADESIRENTEQIDAQENADYIVDNNTNKEIKDDAAVESSQSADNQIVEKTEDFPKEIGPKKIKKLNKSEVLALAGVYQKEKESIIKNENSPLFVINWLYLYIIGGIVSLFIGFFIAKRVLQKENKNTIKESKYLNKMFKKSVEGEIKRGRIPKHSREFNHDAFREKLVSTYTQTDNDNRRINRRLPKDLLQEEIIHRNSKIDKILTESEMPLYTGKGLKLVNKSKVINDKYRAVYSLNELGWDDIKIAEKLHMEVEEVRLALNMKPDVVKDEPVKNRFEEIYRLIDENKNMSDIAKELNVSIGEIEFAKAMKGRKRNAVSEVY
ncbi:tetratricopeptide repeat protein [bacterium]|nr:tetratricopeptide repeat protein [bacterium]